MALFVIILLSVVGWVSCVDVVVVFVALLGTRGCTLFVLLRALVLLFALVVLTLFFVVC